MTLSVGVHKNLKDVLERHVMATLFPQAYSMDYTLYSYRHVIWTAHSVSTGMLQGLYTFSAGMLHGHYTVSTGMLQRPHTVPQACYVTTLFPQACYRDCTQFPHACHRDCTLFPQA